MSQESFFSSDSSFLSRVNIIRAKFSSVIRDPFFDLFSGFFSVRVLTYSGSVNMLKKVSSLFEDIEVVFGRDEVIRGVDEWFCYVEFLRGELVEPFNSDSLFHEKVLSKKLRVFVGQNCIRHEKIYLLEGSNMNRVIVGSANFSEMAFSGKQGENVIVFDNDCDAWSHYSLVYENVRSSSLPLEPQVYSVGSNFSPSDHPVIIRLNSLSQSSKPAIIIDESLPDNNDFVSCHTFLKIPKFYQGVSENFTKVKGCSSKLVDKKSVDKIISHMKLNNSRKDDYGNISLSIYPESKVIDLSGNRINLDVSSHDVSSDIKLWVDFFNGYNYFHGDVNKLIEDYFLYFSWFYVSPFICDFRNRSILGVDGFYLYDYPQYAILYGKSNCGKTSLNRALLYSMFLLKCELPSDNFTESYMKNSVMPSVKRFPVVCEDITSIRINNHAKDLIRDEIIRYKEYPGIVLSTNEDVDSLDSAIRKRCLVIYTGASLEDYGDRAKKLSFDINRILFKFNGSLYKRYLAIMFDRYDSNSDLIELSSTILTEIFSDFCNVPKWCKPVRISDYRSDKYDVISKELYNLWVFQSSKWEVMGNRSIFHAEHIHYANKLRKDVPDNLLLGNARGIDVVFDSFKLSEFIGLPVGVGPVSRFKRWNARRFG